MILLAFLQFLLHFSVAIHITPLLFVRMHA
jgi:hypothetical protein